MAFTQASAPIGARHEKVLSADNPRPERHIIIGTLRKAAPLMGLKATVIATLDAMMSCLPPKRAHDTVFASNATLTFRTNGISDRTIRRHAATLQELGLLVRRDSPNRKRFTRHSKAEGTSLRFGFDLSPLFERLHEIAQLAAQAEQEHEQASYMRAKLRAAANEMLQVNPGNQKAIEILRLLRRKLTAEDYRQVWQMLGKEAVAAEGPGDQLTDGTEKMTTNDGQNVRHHHKSNKEHTDIRETQTCGHTHQEDAQTGLTVKEIVTACPEAEQFALTPTNSMRDIIAQGKALAPMIGIDRNNYEAAQKNLGPIGAAITVWALMQFHGRIREVGAYFRSITSGTKSRDFNPERLIRRLALSNQQGLGAGG